MKKINIITLIITILLIPLSVSALNDTKTYEWMKSNFPKKVEAPIDISKDYVDVCGFNGYLDLQCTDLVFSGKNGMDVRIIRKYNSFDSMKQPERSYDEPRQTQKALHVKYTDGNDIYDVYFLSDNDFFAKAYDGFKINVYRYNHSNNTDKTYERLFSENGTYVERYESFTPTWEIFKTNYKPSYFYTDNSKGKYFNYNWSIALPHISFVDNGFDKDGFLYNWNGSAYKFHEDVRYDFYTCSYYSASFVNTKEYTMVSSYLGMERGEMYIRIIRDKNGKEMYFQPNGNLIKETDRFGNTITYEYTDEYILIKDTMDRNIKIYLDEDNFVQKVAVRNIGDVAEKDLIYYDYETVINDSPISSLNTDYYNDYILKVTKVENEGQTSENITKYFMKKRQNIYSGGFLNNTYLLQKILQPDGSCSIYEYDKMTSLENSKKYMVQHSYEKESGSNDRLSEFTYEYLDDSSFKRMTKNRIINGQPDGYVEELSYDSTTGGEIKSMISGTDTKSVSYSMLSRESLLKGLPISSSNQIYNSQGNDYVETISKYEYDKRKNKVYENTLGREIWYDYGTNSDGTSEINPYNFLLSKTYLKDENTTIKIENVLSEDKKNILETIEYEKNGNGNFVQKNHTSFEYDSVGNLVKQTKFSDQNTAIITEWTYIYNNDGTYIVKEFVENIDTIDGEIPKIEVIKKFDAFGRLYEQIDANGNTFQYTYDLLGRIKTEKNLEDNSVKSYEYNILDNYVLVTNENGTRIKQTYDFKGREKDLFVAPSAGTFTNLKSITYYPESGFIQSVDEISANDERIETTYLWDSIGNIKKTTKKKNNVVVYEENASIDISETGTSIFDSNHALIEPTGNYYIEEDGKNTMIYEMPEILSDGDEYYTTHQLNGQYKYLIFEAEVSDGNLLIKLDGDVVSEIEKYTTPFNKESGYNISMIDVEDADELTIEVGLPGYIRLYNVRLYTQEQIESMRIKSNLVKTGDSNITPAIQKIATDIWGNKTNEQFVDAVNEEQLSCTEWDYDFCGNVVETTDANGNIIQYTYDWAGRPLTENKLMTNGTGVTLINTPSSYTSSTVTYDNIGRKISETDSTENTTTYTYDELGRVLTSTSCRFVNDVLQKQLKNFAVIQKSLYVISWSFPIKRAHRKLVVVIVMYL